MKDGQPENIHMQFGNLVAQVCNNKGLPLPMATEFNMHKGRFRLHMHYDERIARHVTATAQVILREILDALEQKDVELAKNMIKKEIEVKPWLQKSLQK